MESREGTEKKRRPISVESEFFIWKFFITTHEEINIKINRVRVNKFAAIICEIHSKIDLLKNFRVRKKD